MHFEQAKVYTHTILFMTAQFIVVRQIIPYNESRGMKAGLRKSGSCFNFFLMIGLPRYIFYSSNMIERDNVDSNNLYTSSSWTISKRTMSFVLINCREAFNSFMFRVHIVGGCSTVPYMLHCSCSSQCSQPWKFLQLIVLNIDFIFKMRHEFYQHFVRFHLLFGFFVGDAY